MPINSNLLGVFYGVNGDKFGQQYKDFLSDYHQWDQKEHATEWLLLPKNIGTHLSIDETSLSNGELYTILTNKSAKGKQGSIVAIIEGTQSDKIIQILKKIPVEQRNKVQEVTLDMANSMNKIVTSCFGKAQKVIDRFHVQKLAYEALQEIRIKYRWTASDEENQAIAEAKKNKLKYIPEILSNGDTKKQLLARSRYLLFKSAEKWTDNQKNRAKILFELYPEIKQAYVLVHSLRSIFSHSKSKKIAYTKLAQWYNKVEIAGFKSFNTIKSTIYSHYIDILNYFANASAESFNAKIKGFRALLRGVSDKCFFMYRLVKIYG